MATFDTLYTGEGSAVKLPDLDRLIDSQRRVGEQVIKGEEARLSKVMQDESWVMEQMKANPVLLINDKLRTQQAAAIERYNNVGAELLRKNDGVLTTADKLILQREKEALTAMQQGLMADQQRFQQEYALMQKDQGAFYDEQEFTKAMGQFYETGQYPPTALIAKPKDPFTLLSGLKPMTEGRVPQIGGTGYDVTSRMTEDQARLAIRNTMLRDEGSMRGFLKVFEQLPESEQLAILDTDGSGAIDPTERQAVRSEMDINNPIVQWAENYKPFLDAAMNVKTVPRTATQERGKTPTKTTFQTNMPISGANNRNSTYSVDENPVPLHEMTFPSYVTVKKSTTGSVIINNPIDALTGEVVDVSGTAQVTVVGYSPQTDQIIIEVKNPSRKSGTGRLKEGNTYVVDGEQYNGLLEHKDIGIHRQSLLGFKQGGGTAGSPTLTPAQRLEALKGKK
jgi:hypothetical protein